MTREGQKKLHNQFVFKISRSMELADVQPQCCDIFFMNIFDKLMMIMCDQ